MKQNPPRHTNQTTQTTLAHETNISRARGGGEEGGVRKIGISQLDPSRVPKVHDCSENGSRTKGND